MITKRPYATKTKRRTYTVTDEVHESLRKLGNGNASAGIREAVRVATAPGHLVATGQDLDELADAIGVQPRRIGEADNELRERVCQAIG